MPRRRAAPLATSAHLRAPPLPPAMVFAPRATTAPLAPQATRRLPAPLAATAPLWATPTQLATAPATQATTAPRPPPAPRRPPAPLAATAPLWATPTQLATALAARDTTAPWAPRALRKTRVQLERTAAMAHQPVRVPLLQIFIGTLVFPLFNFARIGESAATALFATSVRKAMMSSHFASAARGATIATPKMLETTPLLPRRQNVYRALLTGACGWPLLLLFYLLSWQ
jgi:hypothetical protein